MTKHYVTTLSLSIGGDEPSWEGEATVCYTVSWGRPAQTYGPAENCYPADPDEVDDITVTHIDGAVVVGAGLRTFAVGLEAHIDGNDALIATLLEHAAEEAAGDHDDRADYLRDSRIDDELMGRDP